MRKYSVTLLAAALVWFPSIGVSKDVSGVVSLDLCTDRMLARYAQPGQVLALSPLARQFGVAERARQWPGPDGSLEQILELQPRLVLTGEYNAPVLRQRLRELGVRVEVLSLPHSLAQVAAYERQFRTLLGLAPAQKPLPPPDTTEPSKRPRLLLLGANGIGTGRNTFEDDVLQRAGWRNYLEEEGYQRLNLERIVRDPPDAILWAAPESHALANRFAEHPALKQAVPKEHWLHTDYWRWQCPGPWTRQLIEQLQQWRDRYFPY
jgi:iron complex transport system substrate-binding protein